ncbi:MAG TPA: ornithine cyclodeaminase family protein [Burkholderiaceae bacterium]|nr:ornithine cyclodeaminase family protein [Burkholderiaceae bacterium]
MKIFDAEATRRALPFRPLVDALARMFVTGCEVPLRHTHTVQADDGSAGTVLIMPAWRSGDYLGIKTVNVFPDNAKRGLSGLFATYVLYDVHTGEPLALIDGNEITSRRTAAASALAASKLARPDSRRLLVVGAGRVASLLPEAYRAVLPIDEVAIWARRPQAAEALAESLRARGIDAKATAELPQSAARADIVSCATLATEPVVHGEWLRAGSHLDLIGSFTPQMREADDACFVGASLYVDTDEAAKKSGELLGPMSRGVFGIDDIRGTLADLCSGQVAGRANAAERTVFKSVGNALEDLAAAAMVYEGR